MAIFPYRVECSSRYYTFVCVLCVQGLHAGLRHTVSKAKEVFRSTSRKCLEEAESEWEFTQCGVQTCNTAVDT